MSSIQIYVGLQVRAPSPAPQTCAIMSMPSPLVCMQAMHPPPPSPASAHLRHHVDAATSPVHAGNAPSPPLPSQCPHLRHHVDAAHQHGALDADARPQRLKLLRNLDGQLARGRQHQRKQRLRLVQQRLMGG